MQLHLIKMDQGSQLGFRMEPQDYGMQLQEKKFRSYAGITTLYCQLPSIPAGSALPQPAWTLQQKYGITPQVRCCLLCEVIPMRSHPVPIAPMAVAWLQQVGMAQP